MAGLVKYLRALRQHPGVPVAATLTILGFFAGSFGDHWVLRGTIGAVLFWLPVLFTAGRN